MDSRERLEICRERRRGWKLPSGLAALVVAAGLAGAPAAALGPVTLLSRADLGAVADTGGGTSALAPVSAISADGRYVVFTSTSANLVPGQISSPNGSQVFLFDRATGTRTL
ncbi:MAG: hypothetical protein QOJ16_3028, partial [Acidobacteriota bacterium]|nr:hypothetical protein [Acidobacteriota bacterium]